ncbi:MAG TPA: DUF418 domain-containing protein [Candidatus Polarisedimenticolaceae bacterium]
MPHPSRPLGPVSEARRLHHVDALRGFALLGVIVGNVVSLGYEQVPPAVLSALPTAPVDAVVLPAVQFLVEWKFYTLFSFLFGLGFALQLTRAEEAGTNVLPAYSRRLGILLVIGALHACLLWYGDVLHVYATLGFVMILFRRAGPRTLLVTGLLLGIVLPGVVTTKHELGRRPALVPATVVDAKTERLHALTAGPAPYRALVAENVARSAGFWRSRFAREFLPSVLGKFLLGYWVGRRRFLEDLPRYRRGFARLLAAGLALGVPCTAYWLASRSMSPGSAGAAFGNLARHVGIAGLAAAYLSALLLLLVRPAWSARLSWLEPVGKLALTNYLAHSIAMAFLFYGFGLGLLGRMGPAGCLLFALALYAALAASSRAWLERFRFGPAEWIWRSLTYRRFQPMRRTTRSA